MSKRVDNTSCYCLKMRRSAENVVNFYDAHLASTGVTVRQYSLLIAISENAGCNVRELANATELDRSTLARSLKPLLSAGLVVDQKETGARDSVLVLSEEGRFICMEATRLWEIAQKKFKECLGMEQLKALEKALEAIQDL